MQSMAGNCLGSNEQTRYSYEEVEKIAQGLLNRVKCRPRLGIICGSGLGGLANMLEDKEEIPYAEIDGFPVSTDVDIGMDWLLVPGHAGRLVFGHLHGKAVVLMQGRAHLYEGYDVHKEHHQSVKWFYPGQDLRSVGPDLNKNCLQRLSADNKKSSLARKDLSIILPVRVMKLMGVKYLYVTNAAGGINENFNVGDIMIIKDHFNMPGFAAVNPLVGPNDDRFGPRFPPASQSYSLKLRQFAKKVAKDIGFESFVREGVYCYLGGPSFETVTECRFLKIAGVDATGMSTVPEVLVAGHCGMTVFGMSLITNKCIMEYDSTNYANHEEVLETGKSRSKDMQKLISEMVGQMEDV